MARTIKLVNTGRIEQLTIAVPEDGGVVVLKGRNGVGKSTALEAVEGFLSGRTPAVTVKDGMPNGTVSGLGATLRLGKRTTRAGELEVEKLESKIDPSKLVDPGIKDPDAADANRIRALVSLSGLKPDVALFHECCGGKDRFEKIAGKQTKAADDLVDMAARLKRDAESDAREIEESLSVDETKIAAMSAEIFDVPDVPIDTDVLKLEYETAIRELAALESKAEVSKKVVAEAAAAQKILDGIGDIEAIQSQLEKLEAEKLDLVGTITELEKALAESRERQRSVTKEIESLSTIKSRFMRMRSVVGSASTVEIVGDDALIAARDRAALAAKTLEDGQAKTRLFAKRQEYKKLQERVNLLRKESDVLRGIAKSTDSVLAEAVSKSGIKELAVKAGRLVTKTSRGDTLFADLSVGEKYRIALEIVVQQVGEGGVIVIDQEAWEGLDPDNRQYINGLCKQKKLVALTAESSRGELSVETLSN